MGIQYPDNLLSDIVFRYIFFFDGHYSRTVLFPENKVLKASVDKCGKLGATVVTDVKIGIFVAESRTYLTDEGFFSFVGILIDDLVYGIFQFPEWSEGYRIFIAVLRCTAFL
ncbi:MAG: hypothetical protein BWY61_01987 [Firmicutes bacterium ADurb.Bin354]|nr:MAG: hypothetical protein BWY61_01987 [Firmicutes bacterium ADurb.Bin354]